MLSVLCPTLDQVKRVIWSLYQFYNSYVLRQSAQESDTKFPVNNTNNWTTFTTFTNLFSTCNKSIGQNSQLPSYSYLWVYWIAGTLLSVSIMNSSRLSDNWEHHLWIPNFIGQNYLPHLNFYLHQCSGQVFRMNGFVYFIFLSFIFILIYNIYITQSILHIANILKHIYSFRLTYSYNYMY